MKRVLLTRFGGPEALTVVDEAEPTPKAGQVRLRMRAAGVAFGDVLARHGGNPSAPPLPFTLGYDVVGTIDALGEGVTGREVGERVAALVITGGYAESLCVEADRLLSVPEAVSDVDAVATILNYGTAYQMLHRAAEVRRGRTILVHGAAGGVGTALLQLAKIAGIRAFGTASAGKLGLVRDLGGIPIDYRAEDFVGRVRAESGGVDAVFDGIGGGHLSRSRRALRPGGIVVFYGITRTIRHGKLARGYLAQTLLAFAIAKLRPGTRAALYTITDEEKKRRGPLLADLATVLKHLADGEIRPVIGRTYPLESVREAHRVLEDAGVMGKIVLIPG